MKSKSEIGVFYGLQKKFRRAACFLFAPKSCFQKTQFYVALVQAIGQLALNLSCRFVYFEARLFSESRQRFVCKQIALTQALLESYYTCQKQISLILFLLSASDSELFKSGE